MMTFTAKTRKLGINPYVDVPDKVVYTLLNKADKKNVPVQVKASLNGKGSFKTSVVKYRGAYRLYLNMQMRKEIKINVGDNVSVDLEYDPEQRMPPLPQMLKEILNRNEQAKERWLMQPSSRRREILAYLNSLKGEDSVRRQVSKIVNMLLGIEE